MKTVRQRKDNDCGVACVAMLAGVKYKAARDLIYINGRSKQTKTKDLHEALIKLGREPLAARRKPLGSKRPDDLDTDALIFVEIKNINAKHWMVWDSKARKVRDPWPNKHGYDFLGYLPIK